MEGVYLCEKQQQKNNQKEGKNPGKKNDIGIIIESSRSIM